MNYNQKKSILVVDDNQDVLAVLEEVLLYEHFDVKGVGETQNIFDVITDFKPDLVLMDYILTGINRGELCQQIKTNPSTADLPVILISAYPKVLHSLGSYGCDAFIAKPFNIIDLISGINNCFHVLA
jgi:two-component system cell cycle response regulator/two-component system phosphate regulon response regulator PhoB/two-component system alkaline phosphatase synthesis response regulator PhoP